MRRRSQIDDRQVGRQQRQRAQLRGPAPIAGAGPRGPAARRRSARPATRRARRAAPGSRARSSQQRARRVAPDAQFLAQLARAAPASALSPASILPPGNSHCPASALPAGRCAISTRRARSYITAATTRSDRAASQARRQQCAVALLVLAARAAGTGLVAPDLAARRARTAPARRAPLPRAGRAPRGAGGRAGAAAGSARRLPAPSADVRLGVLRLQRAHQPLAPLGLLALDLLLACAPRPCASIEATSYFTRSEHGREQLEGLALVLVAIVLLRIAAQVDALAQVVHRRQVLAPVLVELAQHDVALDVAHDRRADALHLVLRSRRAPPATHALRATRAPRAPARPPARPAASTVRVEIALQRLVQRARGPSPRRAAGAARARRAAAVTASSHMPRTASPRSVGAQDARCAAGRPPCAGRWRRRRTAAAACGCRSCAPRPCAAPSRSGA